MITMPPVPHRCRRGTRCPGREHLDNATYGAPIPTVDGICVPCERHVRDALVDLPTDYVELDTILGRTSGAAGQFVSGTPELAVPIRLAVEAVQADIVHTATIWAEAVAEILRVGWDSRHAALTRPGARLQRATTLLAPSLPVLFALRDVAHVDWDEDGHLAAVDQDGLDGALKLLELHDRARGVLGRTRHVNRLRTPCPECDRQALEHPDGGDVVTCTYCRMTWTWDEYLELSDPLAAEAAA